MNAAGAARKGLAATGMSTPLMSTVHASATRTRCTSATSVKTTTARKVNGFMWVIGARPVDFVPRRPTMMTPRRALAALVAALALPAAAADPVKVGLVAPFSGGAADFGRQMEGGIKAYFKLHGDTFPWRTIELLVRDTTGPNPEIAKRLEIGRASCRERV